MTVDINHIDPVICCAHDEMVDVVKVIPNPRNPNKHPKAQIELLARIIKAQGWRAPITVSTRSGFIVRGHGRLLAAQKLGMEKVPIDYQEYDSEASEWADLIADNRLAELATIDLMDLQSIITDLDGVIDLDYTGYVGAELDKIVADIAKHDAKFQPGNPGEHRNIEFIEDESAALDVPDADKHLFDGKEFIVVIFSGGIDSTFTLLWAATNFKDRHIYAIFSDPGVELPGAALHAWRVAEHLGVEFVLVKPAKDMFIEIVKRRGWPSTIFPWCQSEFVYKPVNDWILANLEPAVTAVMDGSRGDQVTRLSKKTKTSKSTEKRMHKYTHYHPGYDIHRDTVTAVLKKSGVPIWPGYEQGFARTACWMCPGMKGEQALAIQTHYPGLAAYVKVMEDYMGKPFAQMNDTSFKMKVEIGKRQVARKAKNEDPIKEELEMISTDHQDA